MKAIEYEKLLAAIAPLDLSTLARLEADLARLVRQRQSEKSAQRRPIMELAALAGESLKGLDHASYWLEREEELEGSRASWAEQEIELSRERHS